MRTHKVAPSDISAHQTVDQPEAPHTQIIQRGFQETDLTRPVPPDSLDTIERLPLGTQAARRRKVIAINALQIFVVGVALGIVEFGNEGARRWINTGITHDASGLFAAVTTLFTLLLLLFLVRNVFPLNWVVLGLFFAAEVMCLTAADLALGSPVIFLNCLLAWFGAIFMMAMAGWTSKNNRGCCSGVAFEWLPSGDHRRPSDDSRRLLSPYVTGPTAFALSCTLVLLILPHTLRALDIELSLSNAGYTVLAQSMLALWLPYDVDKMHRNMTQGVYICCVVKLSPAVSESIETNTQSTHRGLQETDLTRNVPGTLGTIDRLPLDIQAAFRRKVLAIIAVQVFAVGTALAIIEFWGGSLQRWIDTSITRDGNGMFTTLATTLVLLLLLFLVRNVFPLNWVVLALFSAAQVLCLAAADLALGSPVVFVNCILTGFGVTLMAAMAGWNNRGCCHGIAFEWLPPDKNVRPGQPNRRLLSSYVTGPLALALSCASILLVLPRALRSLDIELSLSDHGLSIMVQSIVAVWLAYEVDRMHRKMTPDAYMCGVIRLYADCVAVAIGLAVLAGTVVCVGSSIECDALPAVDLVDLGSTRCCVCLDDAARQPREDEY